MRNLSTVTALLLGATLILPPAESAESTRCADPEASAAWQSLLERNPDDSGLRALYALRIQLCSDIAAGRVSADDASLRFEQARQRLLRQWREHNERVGASGAG